MMLTLQDPVGGLIRLDAEACPREGEPVLIRGRKYVVCKVHHEVKGNEQAGEYMRTIVDVRLATVDDLLKESR